MLGAFLFAAAVTTVPSHCFALAPNPSGIGLLGRGALASIARGLQARWQLHQDSRLWVTVD